MRKQRSKAQVSHWLVFQEYLRVKGLPEGSIGLPSSGRIHMEVSEVLELANGDPELACKAVQEIGRWLLGLQKEGKITGNWSLRAISNNYLQWWQELLADGGYNGNSRRVEAEGPGDPGDSAGP